VPETGQQGLLEIWLVDGLEPPVLFTFADQLREDAKAVIAALGQQGLSLHLLSGDRPFVVESMAKALGLRQFQSGLTPVDKCEFIQQLEATGHRVLMVGDGLNDTPALTAASVSMSPSSAIDIAQNAADIVFQGHQLAPVLFTLHTARHATRLVKQNLVMALLYNVIAVPIAVLGYVTPLIAAIAMSSSSLVVIANAFRLTRRSGDAL
jgi:Cu2+-exporting ATPase